MFAIGKICRVSKEVQKLQAIGRQMWNRPVTSKVKVHTICMLLKMASIFTSERMQQGHGGGAISLPYLGSYLNALDLEKMKLRM